jgi:hypothetical protein
VLWTTFILTGVSNAVNLTDGSRRPRRRLSAIAFAVLAIFAYIIGRVDVSHYLGIFYLRNAGELTIYCTAMFGALIGFLWYNTFPAQVFMGDTGSLALGGRDGRRRDPAQVRVPARLPRRGVPRRDGLGAPAAVRVQVPEARYGWSTRASTASSSERRSIITSR